MMCSGLPEQIYIPDGFVRWQNERSILFVRGKVKFFFPKKLVLDLYNQFEFLSPKIIGMDADELLRLKQLSRLAALFADQEFSNAWE